VPNSTGGIQKSSYVAISITNEGGTSMTYRVSSSSPKQPIVGISSTERSAEPVKRLQFASYSGILSAKKLTLTLSEKFEIACQAVLKAFTGSSAKKSKIGEQLAKDVLGRLNSQSVPLPNGTAKGLGDLIEEQFKQDKRPLTFDKNFIDDVNKKYLPIAAEALKSKFYNDHEQEFLSFISNKGFQVDSRNEKHGVMRAFVQFCILAAADEEHSNFDNVLEAAARVLKQLDNAVKDNGPGGITEGLRDGALALIMKERPRDILDLMSHEDGNRFIVQTAIKDIVKQENYIHPSKYGYVAYPTQEKY
jgi:hypothetical protein